MLGAAEEEDASTRYERGVYGKDLGVISLDVRCGSLGQDDPAWHRNLVVLQVEDNTMEFVAGGRAPYPRATPGPILRNLA